MGMAKLSIKKLIVKILYILLAILLAVVVILILQNVLDYHGLFDQKTTFSQPYKEGDSLIYKIDEQMNDTLVIDSIEKYVNPHDPLSIYPTWVKTTFINAKTSQGFHKNIMTINISKSGESIRLFNCFDNDEDTSERFWSACIDSDVKNNVYQQFQENKDCIIDINELQYFNSEKPDDYILKQIDWSGTYGYLNFIYKDGKEYKLISFIRDGVRYNF